MLAYFRKDILSYYFRVTGERAQVYQPIGIVSCRFCAYPFATLSLHILEDGSRQPRQPKYI